MVFCNRFNEAGDFISYKRHNPYFNRWFSAIVITSDNLLSEAGHNPYFNRWFSAINMYLLHLNKLDMSQSLF